MIIQFLVRLQKINKSFTKIRSLEQGTWGFHACPAIPD